jgi:uncharacterized protein
MGTVRPFPPEVCEKLSNYVYRLIDPSSGMTFYVGRGVKNRCFSHIDAARRRMARLQDDDFVIDERDGKFAQIKEILDRGEEVHIVVHRHGLSPKEAAEVEAALIDAYPGLRNRNAGASGELGCRSADDLIREFSLTEIPLGIDFIMCMKVSESLHDRGRDAREAASYAWQIDVNKKWHDRKPYVLPYGSYGKVLGVFAVEDVLPANEFRKRDEQKYPPVTKSTLKGMVLKDAPAEIVDRYFGKRVPQRFRNSACTYPETRALLPKKRRSHHLANAPTVGN